MEPCSRYGVRVAVCSLRTYDPDDAQPLWEAARESVAEVFPWLPWCHAQYSVAEAVEWIRSRSQLAAAGLEYHGQPVDAVMYSLVRGA